MTKTANRPATGLAPILQTHIPYDVTAKSLPGVSPLPPDDWLEVDEAFAGQMALRSQLLTRRRSKVLALDPSAQHAAVELLSSVLELLARRPDRGYVVTNTDVRRPDGVTVATDYDDPMGVLGQLVQEDLCLLQKIGDEHVLTGAVLCFPASWRLDEKFMRPLTAIHDPVASYDPAIAARVQRLFDGVQVGRPLWRFNLLHHADASLHQPRSIHARRTQIDAPSAPFWRSEKQAILRLPKTRAVVFSIHTRVVRNTGLRP